MTNQNVSIVFCSNQLGKIEYNNIQKAIFASIVENVPIHNIVCKYYYIYHNCTRGQGKTILLLELIWYAQMEVILP